MTTPLRLLLSKKESVRAVTADFARQLERETATLHAQIARLKQREGETKSL